MDRGRQSRRKRKRVREEGRKEEEIKEKNKKDKERGEIRENEAEKGLLAAAQLVTLWLFWALSIVWFNLQKSLPG